LGLPFFIKPANLGSSVGISKVSANKQFGAAIREAFRYDNKILIEESIRGREIECSVLGNENPIASLPGEIITPHDFYSYDAKYLDEKGAQLVIPAALPKKIVKAVQGLAVRTFKTLACEGMARVDFFLRDNREIFVNEINTIPGFTKISMYPKLWEASGIPYSKLIDRLIQLALEKFHREKNLRTSL
jgi:D-alanine-D-alanine ligase